MKSILLVEDDKNMQDSLSDFLRAEGYRVEGALGFHEAKEKLGGRFDLVILDWTLPDGNGLDFLKLIRQHLLKTPVIMLTARTDIVDKVLGLESGADDYLTKPFEPRELLARIRARLRPDQKISETLSVAGVHVDLTTRLVSFSGKQLDLTKKEFDLLVLLLTQPNKVFSREELLNKVWGYDSYPTTRTVDTHVLQLRQKTDDRLIETVRGIGYRLKNDGNFS